MSTFYDSGHVPDARNEPDSLPIFEEFEVETDRQINTPSPKNVVKVKRMEKENVSSRQCHSFY